jgi:NAD(P)H-hydrate epimerase
MSLTRDQVRDVDRRAIDELGIPGALLMENAGGGAARAILARVPAGARAVVLCGPGNNGGDGYVVARHLANAGWVVELFSTATRESLAGDAALNRGICDRMGLATAEIVTAHQLDRERGRWAGADALIDGLLGTGFRGEVRPHAAEVIAAANGADAGLKVALDLPSGLDCDSGAPSNATFRADLTLTFVAPKVGFERAREWTGEVEVIGIGVDPARFSSGS